MTFRITTVLATALIVLLAGCVTHKPMDVPRAMPLPPTPPPAAVAEQPVMATGQNVLRESATPSVPGDTSSTSAGTSIRESLPPGLTGQPITVNLSNLPIPTFINEVLGNSLGLTFQMDPAVEKLSDLVTLRTSRPQSPVEFYRIARQILGDYGVELVTDGSLVRVSIAPAGTRIEAPIIYSGRALPAVPVTHRPIFYLMQLEAIRSNEAIQWLKSIYGDEVTVEDITRRNALLISGRPEQVLQAVEAVRVFDRPAMSGRASIRLEPAFMSAEQLASKLTEVLVAEGYGASTNLGVSSSVLVLPIPAVNSVIVFASDHEILQHAVAWARELDTPNPSSGNRSVFYYPVQNTKAADIAAVLGGGASSTVGTSPATPTGDATASAAAAVSPNAAGSGMQSLIVDAPRNALIFQGDPAEWERLLPLIRLMDTEARQVMIELTIAEVTLDDNEEFGVSWFAKADHGRYNGNLNFGELPVVGAASSGLTYLLDVAGQSRAMLKAFADDQRVSILSTPRLLVMSGEQASIDVGTEVPIITSKQTSPQQTEGTTGLLQSIQYRKTGIILSVQPTVYSDDRVDLDLSLEVSEALPVGEGDAIESPSIFNRTVETSLSLRDGGSIVIGGLMSRRRTNADNGIPFLKDVPILGNLFKSQSRRNNKTELVIMIVPYIVGSDERAQAITKAIGNELELLDLNGHSLKVSPLVPAAEKEPAD